jgi:hypothetical protein
MMRLGLRRAGLRKAEPGAGAGPAAPRSGALIDKRLNSAIWRGASARPHVQVISGSVRQKALLDSWARAKSTIIGTLTCCFYLLPVRRPVTLTCGDVVSVELRAPQVRHAEPEGRSKRAKQRANGARLWQTPTDSRSQSPQVNGPSGHVQRRRNTQEIWFASRRPGFESS